MGINAPKTGLLVTDSGIAVATLDFDALEASRNSGDVRNWNDYISRF